MLEMTFTFPLSFVITDEIYSARDRRGRDHMVVGFTTTCAISAYHHWSCELESHLAEVY